MKGNLLIVDDETELVSTLKMILSKHADHVYSAYNGRDGLQIIESQEIHCILCDISMPGMSGVEVLHELRGKNFNTPFIFYTGNGNEDLMKQAAAYGAFDFLDKPALDRLVEVVTLGLKKGVTKDSTLTPDWDSIESDFAELMRKI
jgi:DNA-binding NtrC family response regulator